ncbi:MAG TPA: hypothetical protein VJ914_10925 [Pseudonocardiaceae bacterium]|nr:hypothetical protein [Pseudonocardiaceae bacterium]
MVPESFHDFFIGATSVAGALIGLLFVAISVAPAALTGKAEHIEQRVHAAAAMSAFLNTLMLSLLTLIPGVQLRPGVLVLSLVGTSATIALIAVVVIEALAPASRGVLSVRRRVRAVVWLAVLLGAYLTQFVNGLHLVPNQENPAQFTNQAVVIVVLFAIGVSHTWQMVGGARSPRVVASLRAASNSSNETEASRAER